MNHYQQPGMFQGTDTATQQTFYFASLDTLTRRYNGRSYHVVTHEKTHAEHAKKYEGFIVEILDAAGLILAAVTVPAEAVTAAGK